MNINLYDVLTVVGKEMSIETSLEQLQEDFQGEQLVLNSNFEMLREECCTDTV